MASAKLIQMKHRHMGATLPRFIQMLIVIHDLDKALVPDGGLIQIEAWIIQKQALI